jgi:hypothetical protein
LKVLAVLLALAWPSSAAADGLRLPTLVYVGGATLDVWSTVDCLGAGCIERNPTLAWLQPAGPGVMLTVGEAVDAAMLWAVHRWVAPRHPKLARGLLFGGGGVRAGIAAHNWRAAAHQRRCNQQQPKGTPC